MKKTALFLIQAKAGLPRIYRCLKSRPHVLLSYREKTADTAIYAPGTTWTSGRNRLIEHVKAGQLFYDYYIFLDEDVVFSGMSQQAGFGMFLSALSLLDHPVITAAKGDYNRRSNRRHLANIVPEAIFKKGVENPRWEFQTVDWFDGLFNAFSREAFFDGHLLPYEEAFDSRSWWASQFITVLRANHRYRNRIVQCNRLEVAGSQYSEYPRGFDVFGEAYRHVLGQLGADAIEMGDGGEITPDAGLLQKLSWRLRCRGSKTAGHVRRSGGRLLNFLVRRLPARGV